MIFDNYEHAQTEFSLSYKKSNMAIVNLSIWEINIGVIVHVCYLVTCYEIELYLGKICYPEYTASAY